MKSQIKTLETKEGKRNMHNADLRTDTFHRAGKAGHHGRSKNLDKKQCHKHISEFTFF